MYKPLLAGLFAALLIGCAGRPPEGESLEQHLARIGYQQGEAVSSIQRYDISGWGYIDRHHITLDGGPNRKYLIAFRMPCNNLAFGNTLSYSTTVGSLTRLDKIISVESSGYREECQIGEIYKLNKVTAE